MFDVYGEFESCEEINKAAAAQKAAGDYEAIKEIARENGLDEADAMDYIDGVYEELCNTSMAALGKLKVEAEELRTDEIVSDWISYIKKQCIESEEMARAVRKKGKSLKMCIAKILKWSYSNCYEIDKEIAEAAGIKAKVKLGIPGMATVHKLIEDYYLGV